MWGTPEADIMRAIIQLLRKRIDQGLVTIFIQIKAYRGDPSNKLVDRWADMGRESDNIRWSLPTNRPIFSWTENGKKSKPHVHNCGKPIDSQVALRQLSAHKGATANFWTREDNILEQFHKDKSVLIRARRRGLQCISYQFPCVLQLNMWNLLIEVECRLRAWARRITSELRLFDRRGPRYSTATRLQLVGPLPLDAPPAAICLYTFLREKKRKKSVFRF